MKLSVIIPVHNTGAAVGELMGVLGPQLEGLEVEVILVDDGSTDDSLVRLRRLARGDKRVRMVALPENVGAAGARNAGINISQGEYLIFLDSDDLVRGDFVREMLAVAESERAMLAVCGIEYNWLGSGRREAVYTSPLRERRNREKMADYLLYLLCRDGRMYSSVNKIFSGRVVREAGVRFEEGREFAEDTMFVLNYIAACGAENYSSGDIIFVREPLYIYNYGTETSTVRKTACEWRNWERQYRDTREWARRMNGGLSVKTRALLRLLRCRWRISYGKAVWRARRGSAGA